MLRIILFLLLCNTAFAQEKLKHDFARAKNDSLFAAKHSVELRQGLLELLPGNAYETDSLYEVLAKTHPGEVTGPIKDSSSVLFIKTISIDSVLMACMTFVRTDTIKNSAADAAHYQKIIDALKSDTTTLRSYNKSVLADHVTGLNYSWAVLDQLELPVADASKAHRCNDIFVAPTSYGSFVIKMISDPVLKPAWLHYVVLTMKK